MAKPKGPTPIPDAYADVNVMGDTRDADSMLQGLGVALSEQALTYNFLRDRVYPILRQRMVERFEGEGDEAVGGAWAALRPYTVDQRIKGGFGAGPINVRTGQMKRHLLQRQPDVYPHALGGTLYFGDRDRSGGREVQGKLRTAQVGDIRTVARPVLGVNHTDMELILAALALHFKENQVSGLGSV